MSLWRRRPDKRAVAGWLGTSGPVYPLAATGYSEVDASNIDTSLQSVAVRSAADLIASLASELPVDVYRGRGRDRRQVPTPSWLEDPGGDGHGLADWAYQVLMSWLLRGNLYGEVLDQAAAGGFLRQVHLFHPDCVGGWLEDGAPVWFVNGRRVETKFLHRRVNPMPGQILGLSPIAYHASQIGVSLAATGFGQQWFRDGGHPGGILKNTEVPLDAEGNVKTAKARFLAALRGVREPLVLGRGWEYQQIQVAPEESQFLETMGWTEAQCARIFGPGVAEVLGYSGANLTYSNIQDRDIHLLKYALNRWILRYERLLTEFLPSPQYVIANRNAMLQTNTLQRHIAHASALTARWRTVNEVREIEDLPPVPWGDEPNGPPPPAADDAGPDDAERARAAAELIQKVYLGVGVVLTDEEARELANRAGAELPPGPLPETEPEPEPALDVEPSEELLP